MALSSFALSGGGNVNVGTVPVAVQVAGPTVVITNIGNATVFGSCGGSASATVNLTLGFVTGQVVGGTGGGNTNTASAGIAIPPATNEGSQAVISTGGNSWLWLATLAGVGSVNVANGT